MLIANPRYEWTHDEIVQVAVARATQMQTGAVFCSGCGRIKLMMSRDTGITTKWVPAANVIDRLRRGECVGG